MPVSYEWKIEYLDEQGDIVDDAHFPEGELSDALEAFIKDAPEHHGAEIALVRNKWDALDGITDRQHAYLSNGTLPEEFEYGAKIPARLHSIVAAAFIKN